MIDDQVFYGTSARFQFEPELLLHSVKDGRPVWFG